MQDTSKNHKRLSPRICCSAPMRGAFAMPAMYEQFLKYQKCKLAKELEEFIKLRREEFLKYKTDSIEKQTDEKSTSIDNDEKYKEESVVPNTDHIGFEIDAQSMSSLPDNHSIEECVEYNTDSIDFQMDATSITTDFDKYRMERLYQDFNDWLMEPGSSSTFLKSATDFSNMSIDLTSTASNMNKHHREKIGESDMDIMNCQVDAENTTTESDRRHSEDFLQSDTDCTDKSLHTRSSETYTAFTKSIADFIDWNMDTRTSATFTKENSRTDSLKSDTDFSDRQMNPMSSGTLTDKHSSGENVKSETDLTSRRTDECTDTNEISLQDFIRFLQQLCKHDDEDDLTCDSLKLSTWLNTSHTPVTCPITECNRVIGLTALLSHYLTDHTTHLRKYCTEIYKGYNTTFTLIPKTIEMRKNICLGLVAYGGIYQCKETRPAERGICTYNTLLPPQYEHLESHLPILIMATRTTWGAMMVDKEFEAQITNVDDVDQHLIVIWLTSVESTTAMHATVTVFDKSMLQSRSTIIEVRSLNESQDPSVFMTEDTNFMRLSHGEITALLDDNSNNLRLDIVISEYEDKVNDKCCDE